jgi:hypothetical protein
MMADTTFSAQDKADLLQRFRADDFLEINGKQYAVRPLNGLAAGAVYGLINSVAGALGASTNQLITSNAPIGDLVSALAEIVTSQHDKVLDIMLLVLQRATPGLTREELVENMDYVADIERFWTIFCRQNKIEVLAKKMQAALAPTIQGVLKTLQARIPILRSVSASSSSPTSSDTTTDGTSTESSAAVPIDTAQAS